PSPASALFECARAADAALVELFDVEGAGAPLAASGAGVVRVYWSLAVGARLAGLPLTALNVSVFNVASVLAASSVTGSGGTTAAEFLLASVQTAAGASSSAPYRADASGGGFQGSVWADLFGPSMVWIDVRDVEAPHLAPRAATQRVALNATYAFAALPGDR